MVHFKVTLTEEERDYLKGIIGKGKHSSLRYGNACILINCDEGVYGQRLPLDEYKTPYDEDFPVVCMDRNGSCGSPPGVNMAEIEINVLMGQCLNRRIDNIVNHQARSISLATSQKQ